MEVTFTLLFLQLLTLRAKIAFCPGREVLVQFGSIRKAPVITEPRSGSDRVVSRQTLESGFLTELNGVVPTRSLPLLGSVLSGNASLVPNCTSAGRKKRC